LIVGEGKGDAAFLRYLCEVRGIDTTQFQIEEAGGSGNFESYIRGLPFRPNFDRARGLLIVGDNDDNPEVNHGEIKKHLKKAKLPYHNQSLQAARHNRDGLAVAVVMLPYTNAAGPSRGSLDTLILRAVASRHQATEACIDAFRACIQGARTPNQEDKFRLRCFFAALSLDDPNVSLQYAVSPSRNLVDLNHECFDELSAFLRGFPQMCVPPGLGAMRP
jgi:hypothetical protein